MEWIVSFLSSMGTIVHVIFTDKSAADRYAAAEKLEVFPHTSRSTETPEWVFRMIIAAILFCAFLGSLPMLWEIVKGLFLSP